MAVPGVDRQEPCAHLPQGLSRFGAQGMRGRETQAGPDVMSRGGHALVHCASAFQYGPTSVLSAGNQPAPTSSLLLSPSSLTLSPFSPLSLTSPFAPNLYPAGRQWPNCPITLTHPHMLFPYLCLFLFSTLHSVLSSPYLSLSLCLPACLSICPSFQQPHLSRCPSFHPITASALASQCLSASGYLSRAKHTHLFSSSITSTAVHSHF